MTLTPVYLRAEDEAAMRAAIPWALDADGEWQAYGEGWSLSIVGSPLLVREADFGAADPEADPAPIPDTPAEYDTGFHANLYTGPGFAHDVPDEIVVHPTNPRRVRA